MSSLAQVFRLDGKVALVTGGYGGIGEAVTRGLAEMGANVGISGQNREKAQALASALGHGAFAAAFDARSVADIERMVDEVANHFGRLDILVNCVGLNQDEIGRAHV